MVRGTQRPNSSKDEETQSEKLLDRRSYLKLSAAAAAAVGSTAAVGSAAAASGYSDRFDFTQTLHAVDDVGLDPTGSEPISSKLESAAADNTLIEFPDGEFLMDFTNLRSGYNNFGLAATADGSPVIKHTDSGGEDRPIGVSMEGSNLLFAGFKIDVSESNRGRGIDLRAFSGSLVIEDIHIVGLWNTWSNPFRVQVTDADQKGTIKNITANDGQETNHSVSANPVKVEVEHAGDLHITDSEFSHWGKAIYDPSSQEEPISRGFDVGDGNIHVDNCYFHNNNAASVRTGSGSTIKNSEFVVDNSTEGDTLTWEDPVPTQDGVVNARGVRLKGDLSDEGALIENCTFAYLSSVSGGGIITSSSQAGGTTVRDCSIRCDSDQIRPIFLKPNGSEPIPTKFSNVSVTGTGGKNEAAYVYDREGTSFEDCCFDLSENGQDGVMFIDSSDGAVRNSNINVPDEAVVFSNSTGTTDGITYSDSCSFDGSLSDGSSQTDDGGTSDTSDSVTLSKTMTIRGTGTDVDYTVETTEGIVRGSEGKEVVDPPTTAEGTVPGDDEHWFWWDGEVVDLSLSADAKFFINGEEVDPSQWDDSQSDDGSADDGGSTDDGSTDDSSTVTLSQTMTVRGTGTAVDYAIETTEGIVRGSEGKEASNPSKTIEGTVPADGEHWFWWDGEVVDLSLSADAKFFINGEEVDPSQWDDSQSDDGSSTDDGSTDGGSSDDGSTVTLSQTMTVRGTGTEVDYKIETTEGIVRGSEGKEASNPSKTIEGTVSGDGEHWFWWDGDVVDVTLSADAEFYINGKAVDPESVGLPHAVVVEGRNGESDYKFAVDGDLEKSHLLGSVESSDTIDGTVADGVVSDDVDGFRFSGNLTQFSIDGDATIRFE